MKAIVSFIEWVFATIILTYIVGWMLAIATVPVWLFCKMVGIL